MSGSAFAGELLRLHLATCVPLAIADYRRAGGPDQHELGRIRAELVALGYGGTFSEAILYRTKSTAKEIGLLTQAVAYLAFHPGGIRIAGLHFCAAHHPGGVEQESQYCERCADATVPTCEAGGAR